MPNHHRTFAKMPHWWLFGGCYLNMSLAAIVFGKYFLFIRHQFKAVERDWLALTLTEGFILGVDAAPYCTLTYVMLLSVCAVRAIACAAMAASYPTGLLFCLQIWPHYMKVKDNDIFLKYKFLHTDDQIISIF